MLDLFKSRTNRFAGIDEQSNVELILVRSLQTAEIPDDNIAVDYREIIDAKLRNGTVLLVGRKETHPNFGRARTVNEIWRIAGRTGKNDTRKDEQYCE